MTIAFSSLNLALWIFLLNYGFICNIFIIYDLLDTGSVTKLHRSCIKNCGDVIIVILLFISSSHLKTLEQFHIHPISHYLQPKVLLDTRQKWNWKDYLFDFLVVEAPWPLSTFLLPFLPILVVSLLLFMWFWLLDRLLFNGGFVITGASLTTVGVLSGLTVSISGKLVFSFVFPKACAAPFGSASRSFLEFT